MVVKLIIRVATKADLAIVDDLLARAYPRLLAADYPPSVMVTAVPIIARARPELLASGRYYLAFAASGQLLGAGGWSGAPPAAQGQSDAPEGVAGLAHVRHVATEPDALRQGVGRAVMGQVLAAARSAGMLRMDCLSTRNAVPFYQSLGFRSLGPVEVSLRAGISFPALHMLRDPL